MKKINAFFIIFIFTGFCVKSQNNFYINAGVNSTFFNSKNAIDGRPGKFEKSAIPTIGVGYRGQFSEQWIYDFHTNYVAKQKVNFSLLTPVCFDCPTLSGSFSQIKISALAGYQFSKRWAAMTGYTHRLSLREKWEEIGGFAGTQPSNFRYNDKRNFYQTVLLRYSRQKWSIDLQYSHILSAYLKKKQDPILSFRKEYLKDADTQLTFSYFIF
jgi:hypothetical protein